jgi:hypothetical protein
LPVGEINGHQFARTSRKGQGIHPKTNVATIAADRNDHISFSYLILRHLNIP